MFLKRRAHSWVDFQSPTPDAKPTSFSWWSFSYDGLAARDVVSALFFIVNTVRKIWADDAYQGEAFVDESKEKFNCVLEVIKKKKGFHVMPRRWVVERTFAWLNRYRRLSKDYERKPTSSQSHVYAASSD